MPHPRTTGEKFNVLITGITTPIGRTLAQQLYYDPNVGYIVGVSLQERPYYFDSFDAGKFAYVQADLTRSRQLTNLFLSDTVKDANITVVVHLAFMNKPHMVGEGTHELNVEGTKLLLDKCIELGTIKKFIYKSASTVYRIRPHNDVLLDEEADLDFRPNVPQWIKDRVDADMICRSKMDNKTMKIVVLRYTNIIGENVHAQINELLQAPVVIKVAGFDPMVNLIHPRDVIHAIQLAIHKKNVKGVFNISGKETAPISKFAELNKRRVLSLPVPLIAPINKVWRRIGITEYSITAHKERLMFPCLLDDSKARKVLGYEPHNHIRFG